ncbi:MAG: transporter substrate-binding protein [Aeromicrobium sp.]|jgi:phospholipid/cholesterol/gamma-HCH transport system substrate-binding protein|nr:transporter substrate-binding protein [Aeromicrobium sp.]
MARYRTSFAERNKVAVALTGLLTLVLIFAGTFYADALPVVGGGTMYSAQFAEAGGLRPGNEVRVAGVKVGKVADIGLDGSVVSVKFRVKGIDLGDQTTAAIKVKTMLGQKFLSLDPLGRGTLDGPIPVTRTTTPYDVNAAFSDLSDTIEEIDTEKVEESFEALSTAFKDTPESVRTTIEGLTDLSRTISSRDDQLGDLLESTSQITGTLKDRNAEFANLIDDGSALLGELEKRRTAVESMLDGTARLGTELKGLVKDNEEALRPALARLDELSVILQRNQDNLDSALAKLGPYYRVVTSAMGNGKWVDSYICSLFDASGAPILDNDVERNCSPRKGGGQ